MVRGYLTEKKKILAFRNKIPIEILVVNTLKEALKKGKSETKTNHYFAKYLKSDLLFPTRKGNHIKGHACESHNIWSTHGFTPV